MHDSFLVCMYKGKSKLFYLDKDTESPNIKKKIHTLRYLALFTNALFYAYKVFDDITLSKVICQNNQNRHFPSYLTGSFCEVYIDHFWS